MALILNCNRCGQDFDAEPKGHTGIHFVEGTPKVVYLCLGCAGALRGWLSASASAG